MATLILLFTDLTRIAMAKLFPYMHIQDFLDETLSEEILAYGARKQADFEPARVYRKGERLITDTRISSILRDLGPYKEALAAKLNDLLPEMTEKLSLTPFTPSMIEMELAAHGDGAVFTTHIDTLVHRPTQTPRIISAVYYLHTRPMKFQGGNLRLHVMPFGEGEDESKDIVPMHNSLLVFPSIAPHEVLPVVAPGLDFKDWRFAVNCWVHRA